MTFRPITGATATVEVLARHGAEFVFGLCGHTVVSVLAALEPSPIRFVAVHHEQMASHAADAYARVTGRPGIVLTHLGPGLTNALTGVANASLDRVPLVVISGNVQSYFFGRHAHMETTLHGDGDQWRAYAPYCKRIWRVERPEALVGALDAALRVALSAPPGPVLVDVAMDVFSRPVQLDDAWAPSSPPAPPALSADVAQRIAGVLSDAKRPVLYAGGGVAQANGGPALVTLGEALNAPIAYSLMGKGAVPDSHPLVVGMTGLWGTPAANAACRGADVLLAVGAEFGELDTSSWSKEAPFAIPPSRLLHVHEDPYELGRSYAPTIGAVADSRRALESIAGAVGPSAPATVALDPRLQRLKDDFAAARRESQLADDMPMHPERVLADVRTALPADGVLVADTGWNKNGVAQQMPIELPRTFLAPGGYATMGFGPAAALGAALAAGERPVLALVGDGAMLTNLSVVVTAVEERLPVVWAIMNNGTYATISGMQRRHFGSDYGASFDAGRLDYAAFARAIGADGARVTRPDELVPMLSAAIAGRAPFVLDIPCTEDAVPTDGAWDINELFHIAAASEASSVG